ncbi:hypothetical protein C1H46_006737 [Malus baccata]|uniref:Uncharacterized protein n=1 Tax=Malus baccata TaxID=106549 RepID=A0A540N9D9_MALBA|nr:hypothetical protein C1H46_006737 [Malus baccata]
MLIVTAHGLTFKNIIKNPTPLDLFCSGLCLKLDVELFASYSNYIRDGALWTLFSSFHFIKLNNSQIY